MVRDGTLERVTWLVGRGRGRASAPDGVLIAARARRPPRALPRARQRGRRDGRDRRQAAAAHGGFTTVCRDAQHDPGDRRAGDGRAGPRGGRGVGVAGAGARPRRGHGRAQGRDARGRSGELADAGVVGLLRRRRAGPRAPRSCATRSPTRARSGCRSSTTPRTRRSPRAPRRPRATSRTVLGLKGWPVAAEAGAVARAIAVLADVVARRARRPAPPDARVDGRVARPRPGREGRRAAGDLRRDAPPPRARRRVDRRVTPLGLGGGRRRRRRARSVGRRRARPPRRSTRRCASTRRSARRRTRAACLAALADGTADAIATDHAPHTEVDKHVEFGWAATGSAASRRRWAWCSRRSTRAGCRWRARSRR